MDDGEVARCLSEARVDALVRGQAPLESAEEAHVAECSACGRHIAVVAAAFVAAGRIEGAVAETGALASARPGGDDPFAGEQGHAEDADGAGRLARGDLVAGKYCVEGLLGRGGMGAVFRARHVSLGHRVAIKVLHSALPEARARFLREARISARLSSPHIVRVFDVEELPDGAPCLVMELLEGEDLGRALSRTRFTWPEAVELAIQICEALGAAHAAGVVHRDLKPANVFLERRAESGPRVKVLDFGISKLSEAEPDLSLSSLTQTETVLGSPAYMSPEQLRDSKHASSASDIWSMGVLLHELLTGQRPFRGGALPGLVVSIVTDHPTAPSEHAPGLPVELDRIVLRCLGKTAPERFPSAASLAQALRAALAQCQPGHLPAPTPAPPRRGRALPLAASAIALLGAAMGGALFASEEPMPVAARVSPLEFAGAPRGSQPTGQGWSHAAEPTTRLQALTEQAERLAAGADVTAEPMRPAEPEATVNLPGRRAAAGARVPRSQTKRKPLASAACVWPEVCDDELAPP